MHIIIHNTYLHMYAGVYILASQKNISPPPLKFFPVFVDFLGVFKLHKGILTCVLSLFSLFSSFPTFSFPFFNQILVFHFGQKFPPSPGGGMARIYIPD